ncbi:DUF6361 family protein [Pontiellaceae bacterium B1224]|nr:DUF6361 family protein [Pontiellaceae bacterium B1224]
MASSFTWLDYSERDRQKMVDAISAFREQETRDELGIGTIRDGFADLFFPGTSTIQTRARYFLFIPWMYLALEKNEVSSAEAAKWARSRETALIGALEKAGEYRGNIGREARDKLKRLPSNIYWQGLSAWGIRKFPGSQAQYHRFLDRFYLTKGQSLLSDDKEPVAGFSESNWNTVGMPPKPPGFPWEASLEMRPEDSNYLKEGILSPGTQSSLLGHLVQQKSLPLDSEFIWESECYGAIPEKIKVLVEHARCFSEAIHGAALLYNLMLAELSGMEDSCGFYREELQNWAELIENRMPLFSSWDQVQFWKVLDTAGARVPGATRLFVSQWLEGALQRPGLRSLADDTNMRNLIHDRERLLKRGQARLENPRARELWSGAAGTGRLDFRWKVSAGILNDILKGLSHA